MGLRLVSKRDAFGVAGAAWFAAIIACWLPGAVRAEDAAAVQAATSGACELHVWPAEALETESEGAIRNHPRNFDLRDKDGNPTQFANALSRKAQGDILQSMDLPRLLGLAGATLVMHAEPAPAIVAGQPIARPAPSPTPCYAELVLKHLVFEYSTFAGSSLQTVYQFRVFGSDAPPVRSFSTMNSARFERYPGAGTTAEEMGTLWADALRQDTRSFAAAATAPPRERKR